MNRDGSNKSFWHRHDYAKTYQSGSCNEQYDVIIIGAGITGLTNALELQRRGKRCLIIEQENLGFGTTGGTTSHINNFFDTSYAELIDQLGESSAKIISDNAKKVLPYIKDNIQKLHISCEFNECNFFLFSAELSQDKELEDIFEAHNTLGLETKRAYKLPFDVKFSKALEIYGQGQFNPLKYIHGLAKEFETKGGRIAVNTKFLDYENQKEKISVTTDQGIYKCADLIFATHIPPGNNRFSLINAAYRSYVVTALLENPPKELAQAADLYDPYHYFRYHKDGDDYYLIVGGFDHKTGQQDPEEAFTDLENYLDENFKYKKVVYQWSSQFYTPSDGLPYIGRMPGEEHVYIATGYDGNGMTWGTISAFIIPYLLDGKDLEIANIVDPGRITLMDSAKSLITENAKNVVHIVKETLLPKEEVEHEKLTEGEGALMKLNGKTVAAYCDDKGEMHYLSPACPHMGCHVNFNKAEKSWDCPCHGSRFDIDGNLLTGPATTGLEKIDV